MHNRALLLLLLWLAFCCSALLLWLALCCSALLQLRQPAGVYLWLLVLLLSLRLPWPVLLLAQKVRQHEPLVDAPESSTVSLPLLLIKLHVPLPVYLLAATGAVYHAYVC